MFRCKYTLVALLLFGLVMAPTAGAGLILHSSGAQLSVSGHASYTETAWEQSGDGIWTNHDDDIFAYNRWPRLFHGEESEDIGGVGVSEYIAGATDPMPYASANAEAGLSFLAYGGGIWASGFVMADSTALAGSTGWYAVEADAHAYALASFFVIFEVTIPQWIGLEGGIGQQGIGTSNLGIGLRSESSVIASATGPLFFGGDAPLIFEGLLDPGMYTLWGTAEIDAIHYFDPLYAGFGLNLTAEIDPIVPEPATLTLMTIGLGGLIASACRKRRGPQF